MVNRARTVLFLQMGLLFFSGILQDFGVPHAVLYLVDVCNLFLAACVLYTKRKIWFQRARMMWIAIGVWLVYMLINAVLHRVPILLVLWAFRNWGRGFVFFAACLTFLNKEDVQRLGKLLFVLYVIHTLLVGAQSILFALQGRLSERMIGDHINGIFGQLIGGNGWSDVFTCAVLMAVMCRDYERGKISVACVFVMLTAMAIAGVQELKVFFYEFAALNAAIPAAFAVQKKLRLSVLLEMLLCAVVSFSIGLWILAELYPAHFAIIIGQRNVLEYENGSRGTYKISRVKFIQEINELFTFNRNQVLFGLGFGNCEFSAVPLLQSDFSQQYEKLGYHFFSSQTLYIEGGVLGLLLFAMIPLSAAMEQGIAILQKKPQFAIRTFGLFFAGLTAVKVTYNNAMRTELSYFNFLLLALFYILISQIPQTEGESA